MGGIAQRVINSLVDRIKGLDDIYDDITTVDTVVDGIQTDLSNATDGLGALKALIDANQTDITTVDTVVDGIQTDLSNTTDGLGALKTLIDANQTDLNAIGEDVGTVDTAVDGIQNDLSNATDGLGALKALIDANQTDLNTIITNVGTVDTVVDGIQTDLSNTTDGLGALKALIDANQTDLNTVIAKTDLLNCGSGGSTLNDANVSDTIVPPTLPCNMHVAFNITAISGADDDFTIEVKVGASGSEQVVAYYKITSDGTDTTIDTGSGTGSKVKVGRIDISDILVYTGEQVLVNYTKTSTTDRNVPYEYICGV